MRVLDFLNEKGNSTALQCYVAQFDALQIEDLEHKLRELQQSASASLEETKSMSGNRIESLRYAYKWYYSLCLGSTYYLLHTS